MRRGGRSWRNHCHPLWLEDLLVLHLNGRKAHQHLNGRRPISEFWSGRGSSTRFSVKSSALGSPTYAVILIELS